MLSDEEKAVLKTAKENYGLTSAEQKILVNLIEKQSKEIEANKGYHLGFIDGGIAKRYEYEDTIKSKIEELENQKRQWVEDRDNKHKDSEIIYAIEVLQSLLEKE